MKIHPSACKLSNRKHALARAQGTWKLLVISPFISALIQSFRVISESRWAPMTKNGPSLTLLSPCKESFVLPNNLIFLGYLQVSFIWLQLSNFSLPSPPTCYSTHYPPPHLFISSTSTCPCGACWLNSSTTPWGTSSANQTLAWARWGSFQIMERRSLWFWVYLRVITGPHVRSMHIWVI